MSRVIVFGGAGFIGSSLTRTLLESGKYDEVIAVGRSTSPKCALPCGVKYLVGNTINDDFLGSVLSEDSHVIDLTYSTVPKTSFESPLLEVTENLPPSINLMVKCTDFRVKKYLLISSGGTVYGNSTHELINEGHSTNPISPYGITKLTIEKYALFFHQNLGLPAVIARPSNPFGPNQLGVSAQGFIGAAVSALLTKKPITIYGELGTVRDYLYIDDLANGILACLSVNTTGQIYNISSGLGFNNIDIIKMIESEFKRTFIAINHDAPRPFDVNYNVLDSQKLIAHSGWRPSLTIAEGLSKLRDNLSK